MIKFSLIEHKVLCTWVHVTTEDNNRIETLLQMKRQLCVSLHLVFEVTLVLLISSERFTNKSGKV